MRYSSLRPLETYHCADSKIVVGGQFRLFASSCNDSQYDGDYSEHHKYTTNNSNSCAIVVVEVGGLVLDL